MHLPGVKRNEKFVGKRYPFSWYWEVPERSELNHGEKYAEHFRFHNWWNEMIHGKAVLSKISKNLTQKPG